MQASAARWTRRTPTPRPRPALVGLCTAVADRLGVSGSGKRDIGGRSPARHQQIGIPAEILNKPGR
jgi:hypothetical protein